MNNSTNTARVFFALWPTPDERGKFCTWQQMLQAQCGGRIMRPETLHVTLVFLGEVPANRMPTLLSLAEKISTGCFQLYFDEVKYWEHNHILYAATDTVPTALICLVQELELRLTLNQFAFDQREYHPHVTLLRNVPPLTFVPQQEPKIEWNNHYFVLLQSNSNGGVAHYRILGRYPLSNAMLNV